MFYGEFRSEPYFYNRSIKFFVVPAISLPTFLLAQESGSGLAAEIRLRTIIIRHPDHQDQPILGESC